MSAPMPQEVTFVLGSCQYPAGLLDGRIAEASWVRLQRRLLHEGSRVMPTRMLLVGDQVYVDATAGLFDPTTRYDRFVRPYERRLRIPAYADVAPVLQPYMMLDDHEIEDNWEPVAGDASSSDVMAEGRYFYLRYQRLYGPPAPPPGGAQPLWYTFDLLGFPFFMADTRTERTERTAAKIENASIMSKNQLKALEDWLDAQEGDVPKFIASPSIMLPRRLRATHRGHPASALHSDAWDGFPFSQQRVLAHIADRKIRNVVFLSGDEHLSCVARGRITSRDSGEVTSVHSVHSSPMYGPFPFANAVPADLAGREIFSFGAERGYECEVETEFGAPGDGFALLWVRRDKAGAWRISCRFDRDPRARAAPRRLEVL